MTVLYVFSGEKAQGAEIVIERLMASNTVAVQSHLFIAPGDFAEKLSQNGKPYKITTLTGLRRLFRSTSGAFSFYLKALRNHIKVSHEVYRYIRQENIDVIHANNIVAASYLIPVILFAKFFMRKKIWIWSDHDIGYASKVDRAVSKIAAAAYDRTLAVSAAVARKYDGNKKVRVLYNGLDTDLFRSVSEDREEFRSRFNLPANAVLLGMAAKITLGKGHAGLIGVFKRLTKVFPNLYLFLAGGFAEDDPAYGNEIKTLITENRNIIYAGFLDNVLPYYNGCDIIVSNSDKTMSESLGTTIYEAMAFGKIVVASNIGGTSEIITDNVDGFLFCADDADDLYKKLYGAVENLEQLDPVRIAAREKVLKAFNITNMVAEYNQLISQTILSKA